MGYAEDIKTETKVSTVHLLGQAAAVLGDDAGVFVCVARLFELGRADLARAVAALPMGVVAA